MVGQPTLDQLRAFVTVVEEGSFSAAARKLRRVQSAVSTQMVNLEAQLGVAIWDRSRQPGTRVARLTEAGRKLLGASQRVLSEVDDMQRLAAAMLDGLEPAVSLCVDALFPLEALLETCSAFSRQYPAVDLRIDTQVMSAVAGRVLSGEATLGVVSPLGLLAGLERRTLASIRMVPVVAPEHPLGKLASQGRRTAIPARHFADAVQIVLSERGASGEAGVPDQAVLSPRTWRIGDLHTKHAMVRAGLGWGNLPEHLVRDDLRARRLLLLRPDSWAPHEHTLHLSAIHRRETPLGPAHRWLLDRLSASCAQVADGGVRVPRSRSPSPPGPRRAQSGSPRV